MVTISKPWERSLSSSKANWGSSARHGAHQVAQKSYRTTLPLCESTSFWKAASLIGTSGTRGPLASRGKQNKRGRVRFIVVFLLLGSATNALDGAAEGFRFGGWQWTSRQKSIQRSPQRPGAYSRLVHVVVDGAVIADDARTINHEVFRCHLGAETVRQDIIGIFVDGEGKTYPFGVLADFAGRLGTVRVHENELHVLRTIVLVKIAH